MLKLDLQFSAGSFDLDLQAAIAQPITGLFGPSGAGKTTLLHLIAGLRQPHRGHIDLAGRTLFDHRRRINLPAHRRRVGLVFQDARLFPHRTVLGNLRYALPPRRARRLDMDALIEILGLSPLLERLPHTLSGGQQQRVALARAILAEPQLLLLDEPLASLDADLKSTILPYLRQIQQVTNIPMLVVSHDMADLLSLTDHLLLVDRGRPIAHGPFQTLRANPLILAKLPEPALTNVLRLRVVEHQPQRGATLLIPLARNFVPHARASSPAPLLVKAPLTPTLWPSSTVDAFLHPRDIALATAPVEFISMQNQFPAQVLNILRLAGRTFTLLNAGFGNSPLLVEITHQAAVDLELQPGQPVWALFKTHALTLRPVLDSPPSAPIPSPGDSALMVPARTPAESPLAAQSAT
ncbi:MAG: molybdenum ABC transporter ATP-binding protein [Phycisphaeraceae bacterium]|nr:molybdenum ABC transporter ATP-binding protein [Phycisphaeraceae bacterium]